MNKWQMGQSGMARWMTTFTEYGERLGPVGICGRAKQETLTRRHVHFHTAECFNAFSALSAAA